MRIPTIDIASFAHGSTSQREAVAAEVDAAARQIGFMQIIGHGIPDAVVAALAQGMDDFFGLPLRQKEAWRPSAVEINRGYTSPLSERLSYSAGVASAADLFEAFNVGSAHTDFPGLTLDPSATPLLARRSAQADTLDEWLFALVVLGDDRLVAHTVVQGELVHTAATIGA